ncbi:hypothetical protein ACUODJ_51485, partial [Escherichia sp. HC-CC]
GAQPPTPEWGAMLNEARADMVIAPHAAAKIVPCCGFLTKLPDSTKSAESYNTCLGQ